MKRTYEEINDLIEDWHEGAGEGKELYEYLGWTWDEYRYWLATGKQPDYPDGTWNPS